MPPGKKKEEEDKASRAGSGRSLRTHDIVQCRNMHVRVDCIDALLLDTEFNMESEDCTSPVPPLHVGLDSSNLIECSLSMLSDISCLN